VRADGVIIKPFEASDLLAVIKKLEERVAPRTVAMAQETVLLERPPEFAEFAPPMPDGHAEMHAESRENTVQATVDVPDNMATTAAFSDLLGMDPAYALDPVPPAMEVQFPPEPAIEPPVAFAESTTSEEKVAAELQPEPVVENLPVEPTSVAGNGVAVGDTQPIPAYQYAEPTPTSPAIQTQSEPEHAVAAAAAEGASSVTPIRVSAVPPFIDPGLVIDAVSFDPAPAPVEEAAPNHAAIETSPAAQVEVEPPKVAAENGLDQAPTPKTPVAEDDFEARVAAAMSMYDEPAQQKVEPELPSPIQAMPVSNEAEVAREPQVGTFHSEAPVSFEYSPPVTAPNTEGSASAAAYPQRGVEEPVREEITTHSEEPVPERQHIPEPMVHPGPMLVTTEATQVIPVYLDPPAEVRPEPSTAVAEVHPDIPEKTSEVVEQQVATTVEASLPAVTAAAATLPGADTQMITNVVERILERLKPQMIEEISRELKAKK